MVVHQLEIHWLTLRHREQAPSHRGSLLCLDRVHGDPALFTGRHANCRRQPFHLRRFQFVVPQLMPGRRAEGRITRKGRAGE